MVQRAMWRRTVSDTHAKPPIEFVAFDGRYPKTNAAPPRACAVWREG